MKKVVLLFIFVILIVGFFFLKSFFLKQEAEECTYDIDLDKNIKEIVCKEKYSKTLEAMLLNSNFKEEYIDSYMKIDYKDKENFTFIVNNLLDLNYAPVVINYILTLKDEDINILTKEYVDLSKFLKITNLEVKNIERYNKYAKANSLEASDVVTRVNIGLDAPFYTNVKIISTPSNILVLVNKYNRLPEDYVPTDLVPIKNNEQYSLRKIAAQALEEMIADAKKEGHNLALWSAYRSYNTQKTVYANYVKSSSEKQADTFSARPGHSEHQTGLAADIRSSSLPKRLNDDDYEWVLNNSYKYGFIFRYNNQEVTGYIDEPWHIRYLGVEIATDVIQKKITYDEYYDLYLK